MVYAFIISVQAAGFLPKANGKEFGLKYGETIAREFVKAPKIDGNLDDWQGVVGSLSIQKRSFCEVRKPGVVRMT